MENYIVLNTYINFKTGTAGERGRQGLSGLQGLPGLPGKFKLEMFSFRLKASLKYSTGPNGGPGDQGY